MDLNLLKVVDLKNKLREKGLKTSGLKSALVLRLQDSQDLDSPTKISNPTKIPQITIASSPVTSPMATPISSPVENPAASTYGPEENDGLINMGTQTDKCCMSVIDAMTALEEAISSTSPTLTPNIKTLFNQFKFQMMETLKLKHLPSEPLHILEVSKKKRKRRNRRHITPLQPNKKAKCYLIGDSHLRGFSNILHSKGVNKRYKIESLFQPGAGFRGVADVQVNSPSLFKPSNEDVVVLYCGTNDICQSQWSEIQSGLDTLIDKFAICGKFFVVSVPHRMDNKRLNRHIVNFNTKLKNYIKNKLHSAVFVNNINKQHYYSRDGIHLNQRGKHVLCEKLTDVLFDEKMPTPTPPTDLRPPLSDILYNVVLHTPPRSEESTHSLLNNTDSTLTSSQHDYVSALSTPVSSNFDFYSPASFPTLTSSRQKREYQLDFGTSPPNLKIT
uniref:SAP domain-containing protein n=1 Tax=Cacopsylla melanoneura TaxID=428564 RepID=A0A8D8M156_9HEMI